MNEKQRSITITDTPLINQIKSYLLHDPNEAEQLEPLLKQIDANADLFNRKTLPGHITASGIVIENGKILMIFHPFIGKWLQPGGHVECGETPLDAAMREVLEETGIYCKLHPWHEQYRMPFDIDIHFIPANPKKQEPSHLHYDFRYLLNIDENFTTKTEKGHEICWKDPQEIEVLNMKNLIEKLKI